MQVVLYDTINSKKEIKRTGTVGEFQARNPKKMNRLIYCLKSIKGLNSNGCVLKEILMERIILSTESGGQDSAQRITH